MSSAIIPEIVGQTEILEESPMTPQELQRKVELETIIRSADSTEDNQKIIKGKALLHLCREKLYRGNNGKRKWEEYLKEDSHNLSINEESISLIYSYDLMAFYMLKNEILPKISTLKFFPSISQARHFMGYIPLPKKYPKNYNNEDKEKIKKAIKIWKTACGQAGVDKRPSYNILKQLTYEQRALDNKTKPRINTIEQSIETPKQTYDPSTESANRYVTPSYEDDSPPIKTYEQERNKQEVDLHSECERLHNVLYEAETSLQNLNSVLYNQINKYGSAYLDQMKQIDAGLYTVSDIDDQIDRLHQQTAYLVDLLQKEVEPNDLVNNE